MKHDCVFEWEGTIFHPFFDAMWEGSIEYDYFTDEYLFYRMVEKERKQWNPLRWLWSRWYKTYTMDLLRYCPYCGEKLSEPTGELITEED